MTDWFAQRVLKWAEQHGRTDLPWQRERTPYRVWVAEIMLQQTQVQTVIPFFERFTSELSSVSELADAPLDNVLGLWTGLGYYRRARLLHKAAQEIVTKHEGSVPDSIEALVELPGIGRSTAGAILASGFDRYGVILDGNVKRVLARFHAVDGETSRAAVSNQLWTHAEKHTPTERNAEYAQAIMDLGATCCTKSLPDCSHCPIRMRCKALAANKVDQYPNPSKRSAVRDESLRLLIVIDRDGRTLLERQPAHGLWGGLWLPLRVDNATRPTEHLAAIGINERLIHQEETLASFTHTLSHIRFLVDAHIVYLADATPFASYCDDLAWFETSDLTALGLSKLTLTTLEKAGIRI